MAMLLLVLALQDPLLTEDGARRIRSFSGDTRLVVGPATLAGVDFALEESSGDLRVAPLSGGDYGAVRAFFARHAPERWAAIDGRPVVWLRPAVRELAPDFVERFRADFRGRAPFLVADFEAPKIPAERRYSRNAGPRDLDVMVVNSARDWSAVSRGRPPMVWIEGEADPKIAGFLEKYRKGEPIPAPAGMWGGQKRIAYNLKYDPIVNGLAPVGPYELVETAGLKLISTKGAGAETRNLYFDADDSYAYWEKRSVIVEVDYLDAGSGSFALEYDSADAKLDPPARWHKKAADVPFRGTGGIATAKFELRDAFFANRQAGGADFRLTVRGRGIAIRRVLVKAN